MCTLKTRDTSQERAITTVKEVTGALLAMLQHFVLGHTV